MAAKKRSPKEPFLNTVARTLGHAAGSLTSMAHGLSETLKTTSTTASKKELKAGRTSSGSAHVEPKARQKKTRRARQAKPVKGSGSVKKGQTTSRTSSGDRRSSGVKG